MLKFYNCQNTIYQLHDRLYDSSLRMQILSQFSHTPKAYFTKAENNLFLSLGHVLKLSRWYKFCLKTLRLVRSYKFRKPRLSARLFLVIIITCHINMNQLAENVFSEDCLASPPLYGNIQIKLK